MIKTVRSLMLEGIIKNGEFLDLGCGSGKDSLFAAESGFTVTAIDKNTAPDLENSPVRFVLEKIENFEIEEKKYDVIYADNSLPFLTEKDAVKVLTEAAQKLKEGGVLYFSLFGTNDAWVSDQTMNFWTKDKVMEFVESLNLKLYRKTEEEGYAPKMNGEVKYWHIFRFILTK